MNYQDKMKMTPLHYASREGNTTIVQSFVDSGARIDVQDETGQTPLHAASENNHSEVVRLLLDM